MEREKRIINEIKREREEGRMGEKGGRRIREIKSE